MSYTPLKTYEKCPCGKRSKRYSPVCDACDVRLGHEKYLRATGHESASGRLFGADLVAEPQTTMISSSGARIERPVTPEQMILDLRECSGRVPNRKMWSWKAARNAIEARGTAALEEMAEPVGKRSVRAWLTYESVGGEVLETELCGLTPSEAAYVKSVSLKRTAKRQVVWPSQSTAPVRRAEHAECELSSTTVASDDA